jgi:hypothetical protein
MAGSLEVWGRTGMCTRWMKVMGTLTMEMKRCDRLNGIQQLDAASYFQRRKHLVKTPCTLCYKRNPRYFIVHLLQPTQPPCNSSSALLRLVHTITATATTATPTMTPPITTFAPLPSFPRLPSSYQRDPTHSARVQDHARRGAGLPCAGW